MPFAQAPLVKNVIRLWFLVCLLSACAGHEHEQTTHPVPVAMERSMAIAPPSHASITAVVTPESLLNGITLPADIGYDAKRNRLLVPRSATNEVTIHQLR